MNFLQNYDENVVNYDLINKFSYKHFKHVPKLSYIVLSINLKKTDINSLLASFVAAEVLTLQKSFLNVSKTSNISFNLIKGHPIGCKVNLRKKKKEQFLHLVTNNIPAKSFVHVDCNKNLFLLKVDNLLIFKKLEINYKFFKNLSGFNINIILTNCNLNETFFLLKSCKLVS